MNGRDVCGVHDLTLNEKWSLPQKPQARNLALNGVLPVFAVEGLRGSRNEYCDRKTERGSPRMTSSEGAAQLRAVISVHLLY
jgi:hypothetical protein